jgi:hypothetical protein
LKPGWSYPVWRSPKVMGTRRVPSHRAHGGSEGTRTPKAMAKDGTFREVAH